MPVPPIPDVAEIIARGDFNRFINVVEDQLLEVKSAAYDLAQPEGRFELAKDVAALATTQGGYLIIGLGTSPNLAADEDVIDRLTLVPNADFNSATYRGVISNHVYPAIEGLQIDWFAGAHAPDGIGVIFIPPQNEDRKPFIISKVVEDRRYLKEIFVGYAERVGGDNAPLTPKYLQELLRKGRDTTSRRLSRIEELLDARLANQPLQPVAEPLALDAAPQEIGDNRLTNRIDSMFVDVPQFTPYYVLASSPFPPTRIVQFRRDGHADSVRQLLRDAGQLRHAGFDLTIGALPEEGPDNSLEAFQGERKHLRLYQDGTLLFGAAADDTFLGRERNAEAFLNRPRLSPIALVEVHASYVTFLRDLLPRFENRPAECRFRLSLRNPINARGNRILLTRQPRRGEFVEDLHAFQLEQDPADAELAATADEIHEHPMRVAYRLVERFYGLFDLGRDLIPFVRDVDGHPQIDIAAIRQA